MTLANDLRHYLDFGLREKGPAGTRRPVLGVSSANHDEASDPSMSGEDLPSAVIVAPLVQATNAGSVEQASTLLDEATARIAAVLARNHLLEQYVDQLEKRAKSEICEAEAAAEAWRTAAVDAETRLETLLQTFDALMARAATAEANFLREQGLLHRLQDKIAAAFGIGSDLHGKLRESELQAGLDGGRSPSESLWPDLQMPGGFDRPDWAREAA